MRAISSTASVTRASKRASSSENDRSITSTSTVTCAARSARAPTLQALAHRRDRVVGLGDDPHDLVVGLLELAHVDDPVGHEDPALAEHRWLCTHRRNSLVRRPLP